MRRLSLLLPLALALVACKPDPSPVETPIVSSVDEDGEAESDEPSALAQHHWVGSLALPGNKALDWAIAIEPPTDDPKAESVATLWIPEQMVVRMPVGAPVWTDDGSVMVTLAAVNATWTITPGDSPSCKFEQQGVELDCDLEALDAQEFAELMTPARPQTPKPPFPYDSQTVKIENDAAPGVSLDATLTMPPGPGPHPGVVLISGSGLQDRDETILDHKPFWIIADHLTRNGFAVLRYDDRGFGKSTGDGTTATLEDFASDAHAAAEWLSNHRAVDPKRVGLIGHSEGGVIAPLIAAEHPDAVDFMVLLAGSGVPGSEIVVHQLGLIMKAAGADDATIEREQAAARAQHRALLDSAPTNAEAALEQAIRASLQELPAAEREAIGDIDSIVASKVSQLTSPWMAHFLAYDPIPTLKKVRVPVLILAGDKDLQVDPEQNLPPMKAALANNPAVEVVRFAGLNHLFQPAKTGSPDEYATIEQTIAVEVLERMTTWLEATTGLE